MSGTVVYCFRKKYEKMWEGCGSFHQNRDLKTTGL